MLGMYPLSTLNKAMFFANGKTDFATHGINFTP